jgi:hypothetical protein
MSGRWVVSWAAFLVVSAAAPGCARRDTSVVYAQPVPAGAVRASGADVAPARMPVEARAVVAGVPGAPRNGWTLRTEMRVGNARGHVQIPKGGQPGTTSPDRPTFDEVGVESAWGPMVDLAYRRGRHLLHVGGAGWMLHGSETLREDLVSHQKSYAAGTDVESLTEIWELWLGYGHTFDVAPCLTFTPGVGAYVSRLAYGITGGGQTSRREFNVMSPMFEFQLAWRAGDRVHVTADLRLVVDEWLGFSSPTEVFDLALRAHLALSACSRVSFAIGVTKIAHFDEQPVPNDYLLEVLPWFGIGGELLF